MINFTRLKVNNSLKKDKILPFVLKNIFLKEKQKAFLFLIENFGFSQQESQRFIAKGRLLVNGEAMLKSSEYIYGEIGFIDFVPSTQSLLPHSVYNDFVLFDKPSGVLIHPQNRNTSYSLVDELKHQFGRDANIVHRIDQETSGLVLCSKNKEAEIKLKTMFENRRVEKSYLALVHGHMQNETQANFSLLRSQSDNAIVRLIVKVNPLGKKSFTSFKPIQFFKQHNMTLVECFPLTGRQHQIRVHLFHLGFPIVGDPIYGQEETDILSFLDKNLSFDRRIKNTGANRLMLHANKLEFEYNDTQYNFISKTNFVDEVYACVFNRNESYVSRET